MPFYFLSYCFFFQENSWGHCPGVVTSGDNITHKHFTEMRRLAHDETPFILVMPPRATTLSWLLVIGSVIPLHDHGPNRLAHDETPYPLTRSFFIIFYGSLLFLVEKPFTAFSGIPGRSILRFYLDRKSVV